MNNNELTKDIILSGTDSLAVAKYKGVAYRLEPIQEVTRIVIENIKDSGAKIINFSEYIDQGYEVVALEADSPYDEQNLPEVFAGTESTNSYTVYVKIYRNNKPGGGFGASVADLASPPCRIFINHDDTWKLFCYANILKLTLYCIPILFDKTIAISGKTVNG